MKFPRDGGRLPPCPRCGKNQLVALGPTTITCCGCYYQQHDDGSLGHNDSFDETGNVYCHLCDWKVECSTMEQIEWRLLTHLRDAHGKRLLYRRCEKDGNVTEIPQ